MKLSADLVSMLKKWNDSYPFHLAEYDSTFLLHFLDAVFGREILVRSSAYGKRSNHGGMKHAPLDSARLQFVKGSLSQYVCMCLFFIFFLNSSDIFKKRCAGRECKARLKRLTDMINKRCNDLRRKRG